jgi:hypothetical protein
MAGGSYGGQAWVGKDINRKMISSLFISSFAALVSSAWIIRHERKRIVKRNLGEVWTYGICGIGTLDKPPHA